jgi:sialic acid synthase SpsE
MHFIAEFGSGNTCRNDTGRVEAMIDALAESDSGEHEITIKWQLFQNEPPNVPLDRDVFCHAYEYAQRLGYQTTASVFDKGSLSFLFTFDVPFVKLACRPPLYPLARSIRKSGIWPVVSYASEKSMGRGITVTPLCCVPKYPATVEEYERRFSPERLAGGISDHTEGLELCYRHAPAVWEKHVVLEKEDGNPDAVVAVTPWELRDVL